MLYHITYLLFKLNLIQPSERTILFWMYNLQIKKLEYALKHGNYKTRKLAAEALEQVGKSSSIPVLLEAINDNVQNVFIAALNALEKIGSDDRTIQTIIKKRFNWAKEIRTKNTKYKASKNK